MDFKTLTELAINQYNHIFIENISNIYVENLYISKL